MTIGFKTNAAFEQSCLQGHVKITYKELCAIFGQENNTGDDYKVQAEWQIKFADGIYATIYDYKQGKNYCGSSGISKAKVTDWHIGGMTKASVSRVMEVIDAHRNQVNEPAVSVPATELQAKRVKTQTVDLIKFRNALSEAQNRAVDIAEAIQQRDGSVPKEKLIAYTAAAAEGRILSTIIKTLDACTVE